MQYDWQTHSTVDVLYEQVQLQQLHEPCCLDDEWRHWCVYVETHMRRWTARSDNMDWRDSMLTRVSIHALTTTIYLLSTLHKFTATQWQNLFIAIVYIVSVAQFHRIGYIDDISEFNVFSFFSWISHSLTQFSFGCRHLVSAVMMFAGGDHQTRVFMQRELTTTHQGHDVTFLYTHWYWVDKIVLGLERQKQFLWSSTWSCTVIVISASMLRTRLKTVSVVGLA